MTMLHWVWDHCSGSIIGVLPLRHGQSLSKSKALHGVYLYWSPVAALDSRLVTEGWVIADPPQTAARQ